MLLRDFPDRCLNFGIAEQNKIAAASGMAALGKIPFVYAQGAFLTYRAYEFIRNDICFQNRNVKITGIGSGMSLSQLGPSHHTTEDIAVLSAIPNLTIFSPATPIELQKCVRTAYGINGPVYIRMGMSEVDELSSELYNSEKDNIPIDKAITVMDSTNPSVLIISTGSIIFKALEAIKQLQAESDYSFRLLHLPIIKPFDNESIINAAKNVKNIFTIEEHNIVGGIGSLVASAIVGSDNTPVSLTRIGLNDCFAQGYGTHEQVLAANRLDSANIFNRISDLLI